MKMSDCTCRGFERVGKSFLNHNFCQRSKSAVVIWRGVKGCDILYMVFIKLDIGPFIYTGRHLARLLVLTCTFLL